MDMDVAEDVEYDAKDDPVVDIAFRGTKITGRSTPVISGPVRPKLSTPVGECTPEVGTQPLEMSSLLISCVTNQQTTTAKILNPETC